MRCAVIGAGHLGRWHAQKYHALPECDLDAVVDIDAARAGDVAAPLGARALTDYHDLLGTVDAVSIAVPTCHHHAIAREFLAAGTHVLVEKPITVSVAEADELIALADQHGLVLAVGHLERFNAALRTLEFSRGPRFIEAHRLTPFNGRGTDVDVVLDLMIHDIDIILHTVNSEIVNIAAVGAPVLTARPDIANARLSFANGCVANVTASRVSAEVQRKMRMFFSDSYVSLDFQTRSVTRCWRDPDSVGAPLPGISLQRSTLEQQDSLYAQIQHFVTCVRNQDTPMVGGYEGRQALDVAVRISRLIDEHLERTS
jgi:predicted dehydrogenase